MNILVIAATEAEIAPSIKQIGARFEGVNSGVSDYQGHKISFCVTGVGMVATAYRLTQKLYTGQYDLVIQTGIAGSFDRSLELGQVVWVKADRMGDLGVEDGGDFTDAFDMGLIDKMSEPYQNAVLLNPIEAKDYNINIAGVNALTVNKVTGANSTAKQKVDMYHCALETMEGAAMHYVCLLEKQPFIQIRAISNYVEKRNRAEWQIDKAINNLNDYIISFLNELGK